MSKSGTTLVWLAGPLSGMIVQPIIGALSDASTSPWGRRRPFIICGALIAAVSFLVFGFAKEIAANFFVDEDVARNVAIMLAVVALYFIDIAVNAGKFEQMFHVSQLLTFSQSCLVVGVFWLICFLLNSSKAVSPGVSELLLPESHTELACSP